VGDYRARLLRNQSRFITENRLSDDDRRYDIDAIAVDGHTAINSSLNLLLKVVLSGEEFNEFDIELINEMLELWHDGEEITDQNLAWRMGYEDQTKEFSLFIFRKKIKEFRAKMQKHKGEYR